MSTIVSQRDQALALANQIRSEGSAFKDELRALNGPEGRALLADALERDDLPRGVEALRLHQLLAACRGTGQDRAARILRRAGLLPGRWVSRVRGLTPTERRRVAEALRWWPG